MKMLPLLSLASALVLLSALQSPGLAEDVFLEAEMASVLYNVGGDSLVVTDCDDAQGEAVDGIDRDGEYLQWNPDAVWFFGSMRAAVAVKDKGSGDFVRRYVVQIWDREQTEILRDTIRTPAGRGLGWEGSYDWVQSHAEVNLSGENEYTVRMTMIDRAPKGEARADFVQLVGVAIPLVERTSWGRVKALYGRP